MVFPSMKTILNKLDNPEYFWVYQKNNLIFEIIIPFMIALD